MSKKVSRKGEAKEVIYDAQRWRAVHEKRSSALQIMRILDSSGLECITHGSIARGDVSQKSDVDIAFLSPISSFRIQTALEVSGLEIKKRIIVQATPKSTPKGYFILDPLEQLTVSLPLAKLSTTEVEFYYFGGAISLDDLESGARVRGVDKRLMLIEPTEFGHIESSIRGTESEVAARLNISMGTISERVRVLTRRDNIGRTGTVLNLELKVGEAFEQIMERIAARNLILRRMLLRRR